MLYFRSLQQGLAPLPGADPDLRRALLEDAARVGWAAMHARLAKLDPEAAARIHPNDPQRIQRAIEVQATTGRAMSELIRDAGRSAAFPYRVLKLARMPANRQILHARIEQRFRAMLAQGLVEEVEGLWAAGGLDLELPSMRCVGYRQVLNYLLGVYKWDEMLHRGIVASRQLAKRQLTWLRSEHDCHWLAEDTDPLCQVLEMVGHALA